MLQVSCEGSHHLTSLKSPISARGPRPDFAFLVVFLMNSICPMGKPPLGNNMMFSAPQANPRQRGTSGGGEDGP